MPDGLVQYPEPADIEPDRIDRLEALFAAVLAAYRPDIDWARGGARELVVRPHAVLAAAGEQAAEAAVAALSPTADADTIDTAVRERFLAGFGLARKPAVAATGTAAVVTTDAGPHFVPAGTFLTAGDVTLATTDSVSQTAVADGAAFRLSLAVAALEPGPAGNLPQGTPLDMPQPANGLVRAYLLEATTGGRDEETDAAMAERFRTAAAFPGWGCRAGIEAATRDALDTLTGVSVVGFGDPEMLRDRRGAAPFSRGGRCDLYVRGPGGVARKVLRKSATLVGRAGSVGTWQAAVDRDDLPGFYEVVGWLPAGAPASAAPTVPEVVTRGLDLSGEATPPDLASAAEAAYSRYATAVVQWADTGFDAGALTVGTDTRDYDLLLTGPVGVKAVQDYWADRARKPAAGDVVVRGAVPCFVQVSMSVTVILALGPTAAAVTRAAVAAAVNAHSFSGELSGPGILAAVHTALGAGLRNVKGFILSGRVLRPDGTTLGLFDAGGLTVPAEGGTGVGPGSVAFYCDPAEVNVGVTVV
jgi:hypothetical protein